MNLFEMEHLNTVTHDNHKKEMQHFRKVVIKIHKTEIAVMNIFRLVFFKFSNCQHFIFLFQYCLNEQVVVVGNKHRYF